MFILYRFIDEFNLYRVVLYIVSLIYIVCQMQCSEWNHSIITYLSVICERNTAGEMRFKVRIITDPPKTTISF